MTAVDIVPQVDLTKPIGEQTSDEARIAFRLFRTVVRARGRADTSFLVLGRALKRVRDERLWSYFGSASFEEWLTMPEVSVGRSRAYQTMRVFAVFRERFVIPIERLKSIGVDKLEVLARVVIRDGEDVDEWLARGETLSKTDLKEEVREAIGGGPVTETEEMRAADLALAASIVSTLTDAVVRSVEFDRWRGLILRVLGRKSMTNVAIRFHSPHGMTAEILPLVDIDPT